MTASVISLDTAERAALVAAVAQGAPDTPRIERAVREILLAVGENPDREGLVDTPRRVAKAFGEILSGLYDDPSRHLERVFDHATRAGDDLVIVRDIEFFSMCEHHLLPFSGLAQVVYLPNKRQVVGLSKIARTVDVFARRPQLQERLTAQIAEALMEHLDARGVGVVVQAEHMCMKMRGVSKHRADMVTTAFRGLLERNSELRSQAVELMRLRPERG